MAKVDVVLFSTRAVEVERQLPLAEGLEIRLKGGMEVYPPTGRFQLKMSAVDPGYTLGRLAADRDRLLRQLSSEGILDRNSLRPMPLVPLRVGLVTSDGSAAYNDFMEELSASGFAWEIALAHTRVQGDGAEFAIARALRSLAAGHALDVLVVVRGGGSRADLAPFDAEIVARTIAAMPVPVLTGIGHEIDTSVADHAAHTSFKTPTAVAADLVARVRSFEELAEATWRDVVKAASERLAGADRRLARLARQAARSTTGSVRLGEQLCDTSVRRLRREAEHALTRAGASVERAAGRTGSAGRAHLTAGARQLDSIEVQVRLLDPVNTLARGYSITRRGDGRAVRRAGEVAAGDELVTTVAEGTIRSTVSEQGDE